MDEPQPPQQAIEQLAEFLLGLSAEHPIEERCIRDGTEATHYVNGNWYCELCRGCYEPEPRTDTE
jgi:hypothetical protein